MTLLVLVTIICLGSALLFLPESGDAPAEPIALLPFPTAQVQEVVVEPASGGPQRLSRTAPDRWEIELPPAGAESGDDPVRWPASTERVHAFLRILDRLRATPTESDDAPEPAIRVRIRGDDRTASIGLPATSLGGRSIVQFRESADSPARSLVTTDELTRLFAGPGLSGWVDARPFAGLEGRPQEIAVASAGSEMRLVRAGAGWRFTQPFEAPAEASLVEELLRNLQTLPFSVSAPSAPTPAQPNPHTRITVVAERRTPTASGDVATETATHTLSTAAAPDAAGRIAAIVTVAEQPPGESARTRAGPLAVDIDAQSLVSLVRRPSFYIARRAIAAAPGDIHAFVITYPSGAAIRFDRAGQGWSEQGEPIPPAGGAALDGLASLLTEVTAPTASWVGSERVEGADPIATLACLGLGGAVIASMDVGLAALPAPAEDQRKHAVITGEGVARYYTPESTLEILRWLIDAPSRRGPAPPPEGGAP